MSDLAGDARALLERLGETAPADASLDALATRVLAHDVEATERATRKEVRRLLYRLRQQGAHPGPPAPHPAARPLLGPAIEGFVSAVDGRGDRLVWLVREPSAGPLLLVAADVNEPDGLRDLRVAEVTRKQLRTMRERLQRETGLRVVEADWRAVDALLLEAQDRSGTVTERRLDYRRVRPRLTAEPPAPARELSSTKVATPDAAERAPLVADSATLLAEPEFRSWWPRPEAAAPFVAELREIRESPLVLGPAQQDERLRAVLERATTALYPPGVVARRLEATAYVLAETGRLTAARRALAVAAALRAEGGAPAPFVQALAHQGLGAHLAAGEAERRKERADSLVLTPSEVATARSPSRPPRARG